MKLSDAIRLGAMLKPQGFEGTGSRRCPATCAYGAALDAISSDRFPRTEWPWLGRLTNEKVQCPACNEKHGLYIIPHLNNDHRWTREQIAEFVRTIEPQELERRADAAKEAEAELVVAPAVSASAEVI